MDFTNLRNFMDELCDWRIPGNACVVYYKRKPVFQYATGYANAESGRKMQGTELMYMYSASKLITCTAALTLWEKGKFHLNDPIARYLPEWEDVKVRYTLPDGTQELRKPQRAVSVSDLFTMRSGLDYDYNLPALVEARKKFAPECPTRELARAIASEPLLFEPGSRWCYGYSHDILGALVEVIAGESLGSYAKRVIFDVLGMDHTSYGLQTQQRPELATLYCFNDQKVQYERVPSQNNDYIFGTEYHSGGAGIVSTVPDMAKFMDVLCAKGALKDGRQILAPSTVDLMRTNHLPMEQLPSFDWDTLQGYGYGLGVRTLMDPAIAGAASPKGEFGWTGAAGAYMLVDPKNQVAMYYAHHMLNNQEYFTAPRLRNILYPCLGL